MRPLSEADPSTFAKARFVLTDMDETLTFQGRLAAETYQALERLQQGGVTVIPVTAAPAGWCDQMARMWPVDGVIGENGGLFFRREAQGHGVIRRFWHGEAERPAMENELARIARAVQAAVPSVRLADDQPFRLTSLAFAQPEDREERDAILAALRDEGADVTLNNLWVLGWLGGYDKLAMARRVMAGEFGLDVTAEPEAVIYVGDSTNDAPMFGFFRHSVGVSTVTRYLHEIATPPSWITEGPGGAGFVEVADALLASRAR
jgi:HAD superfamily hydrolase (TIGR01484 family)